MSKSMLTFCLDLQKPNVYTAHIMALHFTLSAWGQESGQSIHGSNLHYLFEKVTQIFSLKVMLTLQVT